MRALLLAIAALGFGVVSVVGPAEVDRSVFEWSAARDPLDVTLVLSASRPETLDVRVPCALARQSGPGKGLRQLFATSVLASTQALLTAPETGIAVVSDGRRLQARVGFASVASVPIGTSRACDGVLHFDSRRGVVRLTVGSSSAEAHLARDAQPIVTGLHADRDAAGTALTARIVTQPTGSSPSRRQLLAIAGGLACALGATVLLLRRPDARAARVWLRTPFVARSDFVVAAAALVSAVLTPALYDDGWVLATVRGFSGTGRFSTYYINEAAPLVQGTWWDALLHPFMSATSNVVVLRLLFLGLALLTWWVVRRWVIDQWSEVRNDRRRARFAGAATAVLLIPAWMTTLRPEPLVALIAAIAIVATVRCCLRPGIAPTMTAVGMGVLALSLHQTGWIVVTAFTPALLFLVPWMRTRDGVERALALMAVLLIGAGIALILFGLDTDLAMLRKAASDFTASQGRGPAYTLGPFDELDRSFQVTALVSVVRRAAWILPGLGLTAALIARRRDAQVDTERLAVWCSVAGYLGLTLTSSKLPWHYGAVMPFSIILVAAGFRRLAADESRWPALKRSAAAVVLVLVGAWAFSAKLASGSGSPGWNVFDLSAGNWSDLRRVGALDLSRPIVWLAGLAMLATALVGFKIVERRKTDASRRILAVSLAAVCAVPVGLTWSFLVRDARSTHGWSFTRQLLRSATGRDVCGLADELPVVSSAVPLARTVGPEDLVPAAPSAYEHTATNRLLPTPHIDTWGTRAAGAGTSNPDLATGMLSIPWYGLRGDAQLAFWTVGSTSGADRITVQARDARGRVTMASIEGITDSLFWAIHRVPTLAKGAVAVRLILQDNDPSGWVAATAPATVSYEPFTATISNRDRVWVAPNVYPYAPCAHLPSIQDGYVHPFAAILGGLPVLGTTYAFLSEASIVQVGCIAAGPCAYRVSASDAASLLRR